MSLARLLHDLLGGADSVAVHTWDGGHSGGPDAAATIAVRNPDAITRIVQAPGQLGIARAYVAGDLDVEGDIFAALDLPSRVGGIHLGARQWAELGRLAGRSALRRLPVPAEESRLRGRRHSAARDRAAIAHHYDVSNEFYRVILGPSMTYSCALWSDTVPSCGCEDAQSPEDAQSLEDAQAAKHDLVCRKLGLAEGQRLLDVGSGWGTMVRHAAAKYGVGAVGVTLSATQNEWAEKAVIDADLAGSVTVRLQDYRDIDDGPYDAISSIGMSEHVGRARLLTYFGRLYALLRPGGRLLNHAISSLPLGHTANRLPLLATLQSHLTGIVRANFIDRYIFPDGELLEVGEVVSAMQAVGFEVRHLESLREHYGLTLRRWVANLEHGWDDAVEAAGLARARTWRLYMAAAAKGFESGRTGVHQVLAVKPDEGRSGLPLRPAFG